MPLKSSSRTKPCDLCQATNFEVVAERDRRRRPLNTVICTRCGLVAHEEIPTDEEIDRYYSVQYRTDYHGEFTPSAHRVVRAWEVGQSLVELTKPYVRPQDRVFEIGAGIGCTVKAFEDAGYVASGIEPGEGFCDYAMKEVGANVWKARLADVPTNEKFDFVLLVHVIEHFNSPRQAVRQIRELMNDGGRLFVECPNIGAPHAAPGKLFHFAHIHNFTPQTVQMLCESCGFRLRQQMADESARVVRMLFETSDRQTLHLIPGSYEAAMSGIFRYNAVTYHLRREYLKNRFRRATNFLSNHVLPSRRVRSLFSRKQHDPPSTERKAA